MRRSSIAIAAAVASLLLGACGGGSDEPAAEPVAPGGSAGGESSGATVEATASEDAADTGHESGREDDKQEAQEKITRLPEAERVRELPLVEHVVRDLLAGMNARDPSICTRLFDQRLVEPSERAQKTSECQAAIAEHPGGLELAEIESVQFRETPLGTESIVQFLARQQGRSTTRFRYHLLRSGSGYRVDQPLPVEQPDA